MNKEIETETKQEAKKEQFVIKKRRKARKVKIKPYEKRDLGVGFLSSAIDVNDRIKNGIDSIIVNFVIDTIKAGHEVISNYKESKRTIAASFMAIGVFAAAILIVFDRFTVYEYSYNGKLLGYVKEQEEVTDVLQVAGEKLTQNSGSALDIKFVANRNITFNLIDSRGKDLDDADTAVNKLVYMTDIETEASGIYDGDSLIAIVKSDEDAEKLLNDAMRELSRPDRDMHVTSAEFGNALDIRPLNVLLISVQDNASAGKQMVEGGDMEVIHIVEEGENLETLVRDYAVEPENILDETRTKANTAPEKGDKVYIKREVAPLNVRMIETGRLKEVVEFRTIKRESDKYYKGDTYVQQEGRNGYRTFEGTIIKEGGVEVGRKGRIVEERPKVRNKIILVGTAERPRTAPTGTYAMPIKSYTLSSPFGPRWGRMHTGLDMAAPTGTPIYATDGGTVIRSSYYGGYGNCVDIDHGNGRVTRYGHCSQLLVNVGEKVYQGQNIALVGSTGNSTGSHLHFEVILNGSAVDPQPILGI